MKLAVLFSGGKDSTYALFKAMQKEQVVCLISLLSQNKESYMFHTPNIDLTAFQAEALGLPLILRATPGEKEDELTDLAHALAEAKKKHAIEGVVTGAIESVYQAERVQRVCHGLGLWCFNPLWKKNQVELLNELLQFEFSVIISGVFAYPFDKSWLGKIIDSKVIAKLVALAEEYKINPAGEGGEIETTVLNAPMFRKKLKVLEGDIAYENYSGVYIIKKVELIDK